MTSQVSNQGVRGPLSRPEVEALKIWAFALALALGAGVVYIIGLSVMTALATGQG